jgi:hypothetical protein
VNRDPKFQGVICTIEPGMSRVSCWLAVTLATAALGAGLAWAAGGWRIEPTARAHVELDAISCPSATRCWAVGGTRFTRLDLRQRSVIELWNGHRWTVVTAPSPHGLPFVSFTDVSCPSAGFCMAVGAAGQERYSHYSPFADSWDGRTWTSEPMVSPGKQDAGEATSVSCTSRAACVALGQAVGVFAKRWNGHDWRTIRSPIGAQGLWCMSAATCIAGLDGRRPGAQLWNGRRWIPQVIPIPRGIGAYRRAVAGLTALSCPAARRCVGLASVRTGYQTDAELTATWNGHKWTSAVIPGASTSFYEAVGTFWLTGISCPATRACVAVGSKYPDPIAAHWNGRTWAVQTLPKPADTPNSWLGQVSCHTATSCMAIGSSGNQTANPIIIQGPLTERYQG